MLKKSGFPYNDIKVRMQSVWSSVSLFDVLVVIFDVHRHLTRSVSFSFVCVFFFPFGLDSKI